MITLFTGTPGSGKTHEAVRLMRDIMLREPTRPLFVHGIPELKIPHQQIYCRSPDCDVCNSESLIVPEYLFDKNGTCVNQFEVETAEQRQENTLYVEDWHLWAKTKPSALLFLDEAQRFWRPRPSGSKVPPNISTLETHRHYGLDLIIVTQSPSLIDTNVKRLVSKHVHLLRRWDGDYAHEWAECKDSTASRSGAIRSRYKLNKEIFALYKSASFHTKLEKRKPLIIYLLPVFLLALVFSIWNIFRHWSNKTKPKDQIEQTAPSPSSPQPQIGTSTNNATNNVTNTNQQPDLVFNPEWFNFTPRVAGIPATAPAYDGQNLRAVTHPVLTTCRINTTVVQPKDVHQQEKIVYQDRKGKLLTQKDVDRIDSEIERLQQKLERFPDHVSYYANDQNDPNRQNWLKRLAVSDLIEKKIRYRDGISSDWQYYYVRNHREIHLDDQGNPIGTKYIEDCTCYTQQDTVYATSKDFCLAHTQHKVFNPYQLDKFARDEFIVSSTTTNTR